MEYSVARKKYERTNKQQKCLRIATSRWSLQKIAFHLKPSNIGAQSKFIHEFIRSAKENSMRIQLFPLIMSQIIHSINQSFIRLLHNAIEFLKKSAQSDGKSFLLSVRKKQTKQNTQGAAVKVSATHKSSNYANNIILWCRLFRLNSIIYQSTNEIIV